MLGSRYLAFLFRLVLGAILIAAGAGKLLRQGGLVDVAARLGIAGIVPEPLSEASAWALPPLETLLGALFVAGLFQRPASVGALLLVFGFMAVNVSSILGGTSELECECFGDIAVITTGNALLIDAAMLLMAVQVLLHRGEFLSLDSRLKGHGTTDQH
ncbi:MAG: DoxX family membrane protein [Chloroflexi bacterium]|nr:DoxX family membrane protein [Chloroflexota bacterium]